ncbi:MAG: hypothetical protein ACFCGT_17540 [Sandaracinaceae bacterium]
MSDPKPTVRVQTRVAVPPDVAFRAFTQEVDAWWRRGPRFRFGHGDEGVLRFEPRVGGRFLEERPGAELLEVG